LVFVNIGEDSVMVNDAGTPLNLPVAPVEEEKLEKTPLVMHSQTP